MPKSINSQKSFCISNALLILLLPFLFLLGLVLAYFGVFSLNVSVSTLLIIAFIFFIFTFFVRHNAYYAVCHIKETLVQMEDELNVQLRENALTILGETKSTLKIKDFISEYYREIRNDNFARVATSVFPMLGILGTFVSIALSMPDFTVQNSTVLDHEISQLLSGIGTAFYASIFGIMLSLLWTYFEKVGIANMEKQIINLEKAYKDRIWKKSELLKHQHIQSDLKDQNIINTLNETFDMDFIKELNEQYLNNFKEIMNETNKSFNLLSEHMQVATSNLNETLERIYIKNEGVDAISLMIKNMAGFNTNAKNLQESMNKFDKSVDYTFHMIDKELAKSVRNLTSFTQITAEQNEIILDNVESIKKEFEEIKNKKVHS